LPRQHLLLAASDFSPHPIGRLETHLSGASRLFEHQGSQMAKTARREPSMTTRSRAKETEAFSDSQHSHIEYGSTRVNWDRGNSTDFAITTVNVPDRLDAQELRARADADYAQPRVSRLHPSDFIRWGLRLLWLGILAVLAWGAIRIAEPIKEALSPSGLSERLTVALGTPTTVRGAQMTWWPSPRLTVEGIDVVGRFSLPMATIYFNWRDAYAALRDAEWVLGEIRIAPLELNGTQAMALLQAVPSGDRLPRGLSTIRFESVSFAGVPFLPVAYEAVVRRGINKAFNLVTLKPATGDANLEIEISAPQAVDQLASFKLYARGWQAPVGPRVAWSEAVAQGKFSAATLLLDSYSVGAPFGNMNGTGVLVADGNGWSLKGNLKGADVRVGSLIGFVGGKQTGEASKFSPFFEGTAKFDLAITGSGPTVAKALDSASVSGTVSVPASVLEGINLGLVATQHDVGGAGGSTRLAELEAQVFASSAGVAIRNIAGRAGNLKVGGGLNVTKDLSVNGSLSAAMATARGGASAVARLSGTVVEPRFSR
jgi:hypothetical protein